MKTHCDCDEDEDGAKGTRLREKPQTQRERERQMMNIITFIVMFEGNLICSLIDVLEQRVFPFYRLHADGE